MRLIPKSKSAKVAYFNSQLAPWSANATEIGTTSAAVSDLEAKVAAARAKIAEKIAAQAAARTATMAADNAIGAMVEAGGDIIQSIRAKAASSGSGVYALAQIPAPAAPAPVTELGKPTNFKIELSADGSLILKWKCASPRASGVIYQVWRSSTGGTDFAYVGGTGSKTFIDSTVPAGTARLLYKVQAMRSTATGPWATFTVLFGSAAGQTAQPRLAA